MIATMEAWDIMKWDSRHAHVTVYEWPTLRVPHVSTILRLGDWEVVSCSVVRCGFLWLDEAYIWTFRKRILWVCKGDETSFVGTRVTPQLPDLIG